MRLTAAAVLLCVGWVRVAGASAAPPAPPSSAASQVTPSLVASVARVEAGRPFTLGVRFAMAPGWHIYWRNPGDSGLPTTIRWTLPDGAVAGPLGWPVPMRFGQPGGVTGYGYDGTAVLAAEITPPATLAAGAPFAVRADVGWLACEQVCIRGKQSLTLDLPVGAPAEPAHAELFEAWRRALPVDAAGTLRAHAEGAIPRDGAAGTLAVAIDWSAPPTAVEWFPAPEPSLAIDEAATATDGARTTLTLRARTLSGQAPPGAVLDGVLVYTTAAGDRRGVRFPLALNGKESP